MSSVNYENQILDAIQTIVNNAVETAGYDRTIKAMVTKCEDATIGKYIIKYQNSSFYAFAATPDIKYRDGSMVYILVPGNDMRQDKTILGTVDALGANYTSAAETENGYEINGNNVITSEKGFSLCSYENGQIKTLYDYEKEDNEISIDNIGASLYAKDTAYIVCGANFKTILNTEQKSNGDYGICFDLDFYDNATREEVTKTYVVNINKMNGNPYNFTSGSRQVCVFEADGNNFIRVRKVYIYERNFPKIEPDHSDDIFISAIELGMANEISPQEIASNGLVLVTPKGAYFDDSCADTDTKVITAKMRIKGNIIESDSNEISYYWFKENNTIDGKNEKYNRYGGAGWECLNAFNKTIEVNEKGEEITLISWIPSGYSYETLKENNIANKNKYKCVAVYNDKNNITLEKEVTIYNLSSRYEVIIESDSGTNFYQDQGYPTLTCNIKNGDIEEDPLNYTFVWSVTDNYNNFDLLPETEDRNKEYNDALNDYNYLMEQVKQEQFLSGQVSEQINRDLEIMKSYNKVTRVEKNIIHHLKINTINSFSIYKCSVYNNDNKYIGTSSIVLTNSLTNTNEYSLIINEGNQVFKYNESGVSPDNGSNENPQAIYPLSFTLFDDNGYPVEEDAILLSDIAWIVPNKKTLLGVDSIYTPTEEDELTNTYRGYREFNFNINQTYDAQKANNTIQLVVNYKGKTISAITNFTFVKTGENGTNGTEYICKIVPNTIDGSVLNDYPMITIDDTQAVKEGILNYLRPVGQSKNWFKVQLWHNGEKIFDNIGSGITHEDTEANVKWEVLRNVYGKNLQDDSNLIVSEEGEFDIDTEIYENPANIIKCSVIIDGVVYYATMPIMVARIIDDNYKIKLLSNTGFTSAMYTTDGQNPAYNNIKPFTLEVLRKIDGIIEDVSLLEKDFGVNYEWSVLGATYRSKWQSEQNLIAEKAKNRLDSKARNEIYYKPKDTFDGLCVTNGLNCYITDKDDNPACEIYIPIHLYLNRYGNSAMNGWDGNSIDINEDEGLILAPQVGAGTKTEENGFTGVFMGQVQEADKKEAEFGLYGYNNGERTIALSAEDGSARFGKTGSGQIVIDPATGEAIIKSGDYSETDKTGMAINLSEPSIEWANGKFKVDKDGTVIAANGMRPFDELLELENDVDIIDQSVSLQIASSQNTIILPMEKGVQDGTYIVDDSKTWVRVFANYKGKNVVRNVVCKIIQPIKNVDISWHTENQDGDERGFLIFETQRKGVIEGKNNIAIVEFTYVTKNASGERKEYKAQSEYTLTAITNEIELSKKDFGNPIEVTDAGNFELITVQKRGKFVQANDPTPENPVDIQVVIGELDEDEHYKLKQTVFNKNYIMEESENLWYNKEEKKIYWSTSLKGSAIGYLPKTGAYTISKKNIGTNFAILKTKEKPANNVKIEEFIFESPDMKEKEYTFYANEGEWILFCAYDGDNENDRQMALEELQLEFGEEATSYQEGQHETYYIDLTQVLLDDNEILHHWLGGTEKVSDIYSNGVITKKFNKVELNGNESGWTYDQSEQGIKYFSLQLSDANANAEAISSHFKFLQSDLSIEPHFYIDYHSNLRIFYNNISTIEDFKAFLAAHPITLYYELKESISIPVEYAQPRFTYGYDLLIDNDKLKSMMEIEYYTHFKGEKGEVDPSQLSKELNTEYCLYDINPDNWADVKDEEGRPIRTIAPIWRENPFKLTEKEKDQTSEEYKHFIDSLEYPVWIHIKNVHEDDSESYGQASNIGYLGKELDTFISQYILWDSKEYAPSDDSTYEKTITKLYYDVHVPDLENPIIIDATDTDNILQIANTSTDQQTDYGLSYSAKNGIITIKGKFSAEQNVEKEYTIPLTVTLKPNKEIDKSKKYLLQIKNITKEIDNNLFLYDNLAKTDSSKKEISLSLSNNNKKIVDYQKEENDVYQKGITLTILLKPGDFSDGNDYSFKLYLQEIQNSVEGIYSLTPQTMDSYNIISSSGYENPKMGYTKWITEIDEKGQEIKKQFERMGEQYFIQWRYSDSLSNYNNPLAYREWYKITNLAEELYEDTCSFVEIYEIYMQEESEKIFKREVNEEKSKPVIKEIKWSDVRPSERVNRYPILWTRNKFTYVYRSIDDNQTFQRNEYSAPVVDESWSDMYDFQETLNEKVLAISNAVDNKEGFVTYESNYILIGDDRHHPSNVIIINNQGITFAKMNTPLPEWPMKTSEVMKYATSAWSIDGNMNLQGLDVKNITATSIADQKLVLGQNAASGAPKVGSLIIKDSEDHEIFQTVLDNSGNRIEGFKILKYKSNGQGKITQNGYIYLSKDGIREYSTNNNENDYIYRTSEQVLEIKNTRTEELTVATKNASGGNYGIKIIPMKMGTHQGVAFVKFVE